MICAASPNVISSQAQESGRLQHDEPDGATTSRCGPDPALANLSARQAKAAGLLTSGTYGPLGSGSSNSAALSASLASKLQAVTSILGSTLYKLTWKEWTTPSGVCRLRLRATALRTSETARSGWPTPMARDHFPAHTAEYVASKVAQGHGMANLNDRAQLTGWTTPNARDWKDSPSKPYRERGGGSKGMALDAAAHDWLNLAGWPTPTVGNATGSQMAKDASSTGRRPDGSKATVSLNAIAQICGPARLTVSGEMLTGSAARMESGGQLCPLHSLWLMLGETAFEWLEAAERINRTRAKSTSRISRSRKLALIKTA